LTNYSDINFTSFTVAQMPSGKYYVFGSERGTIIVFDRLGHFNRVLRLEGAIKQVDKVNNNLVVLTTTKLLHFNLNKNFSGG